MRKEDTNIKDLENDIKNKTFKHCYLIYGKEDYLKNVYKKRFIESITDNNSMNYKRFSDNTIDVDNIISYGDTVPFFSDYRLVLIENSGFFKTANDHMCDYILKIPETTVIIFLEKEVDKRNKLFKAVNKNGISYEFDTQSQNNLLNWIKRYVSREKKYISEDVCRVILQNVGDDMSLLSMELEKLVSYCVNKDEITKEDVLSVCIKNSESIIFDLFDAMAEKNTKKTFSIYYELVSNKEPLLKIMFMLEKQFNQIIIAKDMNNKHLSNYEIGKTLGTSEWAVKKILAQGKNKTLKQLKDLLELCITNEELIKTGKLDGSAAVEMVLVKNKI